jgi:beta-barrel assembly-enhancing protease
MQLSYKARFENGQSPLPYTVDVSFSEEGILISYVNEEGELFSDRWMSASITEKQNTSSIITLRYGTGVPYEQLDITDPQALAAYRLLFKPRNQKIRLSLTPARLLLPLIGGFIGTLILAYLYLLPLVADEIARRFPKDMEIAIGNKMYASILEQSEIDTARTEAIQHFFAQLHIRSEYPIRIAVVRDTIVNAFAVPGGGIVVYDAIVRNMKTPEELAALLSHEYSHVELKHATRNLFRNLGGYLFLSMVISDANGIASILLRQSENLRTLKYSRDLEHEADVNGLKILKRNQVSASGMVALFEQLKKQETGAVTETWSTHPDIDARIVNAKLFARENPYATMQHDSLNFYFKQLQYDNRW